MLLALLLDPGPRATPHPPKHKVFPMFAFIIVFTVICIRTFIYIHFHFIFHFIIFIQVKDSYIDMFFNLTCFKRLK